jgi:hypothetical protein
LRGGSYNIKENVKKEKVSRFQNKKGVLGVLFYNIYPVIGFFRDSGVRGGGKCPEEEHTTCSGGPTILVTSAVYGEREKSVKKERK